MQISVVIPFYGKWELVHQRLMELYRFIDPSLDMEIILINDKPGDVQNGVGWWQKESSLKVRYFHNKENLGFGGSMNLGANKATGDIIILLSNDVIISGNFIHQIIGALSVDNRRFIGNVVYDFDTGWNELKINGKNKLFPYAEGYLLACTKETWQDLGGFDPIYEKFDYEDVDISAMALHKGYKLYALNSPFIRHMSGQTVRANYPNREKYTLENQKRFRKKWSEILKDE